MIFSNVVQTPLWEKFPTPPFDECIVSWNGIRPKIGKWTFWVSLHQDHGWSSWLRYAEWGAHHQKTFKDESETAKSYQDAIHPKSGLSDGFRVRVEAEEGANLSNLVSLTASICERSKCNIALPQSPLSPVLLTTNHGQSQNALQHPHSKRICSPTSVANAIDVLTQKKLDPIEFSLKVHDNGFDIYGNWILNVAAAYSEMGGAFSCHVERLPSFEALHAHLLRGFPVVVSVRGPLEGAPQPYAAGHLICVIGYDEGKVVCIDPGFPTDETTRFAYSLPEFLNGWNRRQNVAYIFG